MKSQVLDKGFIDVVDSLGNDLTVVNSARVSFGKRKTKFDKLHDAFYKGDIANTIIKHSDERNGLLAKQDFDNFDIKFDFYRHIRYQI
mgnify:CR=1 FL=1